MTWHRIDDPDNPAPKDGTVIRLMAMEDGEFVNEDVGGWSDECEMWDCPFRRYSLSWFTHWQPLPAPPSQK